MSQIGVGRTLIFTGIAIVVVVLVMAVAGCGKDADVNLRDKGDAKALINMPDHFDTIALKCYHGKGIYLASTGGSSPTVILNDPDCR